MITFVSAFFCRGSSKHTLDEYQTEFHRFAETGVPIVLFLDPNAGWTSFPPNVNVVPLSLADTWVGRSIPIDAILPEIRSATDTREYMTIISSKSEILLRASRANHFGTEWFAWVDFGLSHVFRTPDATFARIKTMIPPKSPCIRTAGIWTHTPDSLFTEICWRFAGGFILAHESRIEPFHDAVIASIGRNLPRLTWEVNIWADVERTGMDLGWFRASHDDSIIPPNMDPEYDEPAGRQHYRLLEELSATVSNATLVDIGTHKGMSAYALSSNLTNRIVSFDIVAKDGLPSQSNIEYRIDNLMTPEGRAKWKDVLLAAPIIFLDIDPHDGVDEYVFYEWLRDNAYSGTLVCDDIWYFKGMRDNFWYKIPSEHKQDVTNRGHWSGTGIVRFDFPPPPPSTWTVVTAYFDLTKMPDASSSIKSRPSTHYLENATSTMMLDQNLVVFCEPDMVSTLRSMRPERLQHKTQYIPMSFEEFPLTQCRDRVTTNRKSRPSADDRNTPSYYLFCMARYAMLKRVIAENPFGSTHFAWLNMCIERMGWKNLVQLPRVFELNRDRFSTCYIDYQPKDNYLENVMRWGRCSMCSGFFTGNTHYMKTFCDRIEDKFLECLEKGYGHADEQLYSLVYFDDPSIFEVYYGDYTEMITNYEWIRDRPQLPLYLLIKHSYDARDRATCLSGCLALWRSWKGGYAILSEQELTHLIWYYERCLPQPRVFE